MKRFPIQPRDSAACRVLRIVVAAGAIMVAGSGIIGEFVFGDFGCYAGWLRHEKFTEGGGEGDAGREWSVGSLPDRVMLVSRRFDESRANDLPANTPRRTIAESKLICGRTFVTRGLRDWADPSTYPTSHGFGLMDRDVDLSSHMRQHYAALIIPHWCVLALATLPLATIVVRELTRRNCIASGRCQVCGYDLRASMNRCPECRTVIEVKG